MTRCLFARLTNSSRGLWAAMLLCHVPALAASAYRLCDADSATGSAGGFASLCAAMIFFALKFCQLPALRFNTDRRSVLALTVAVALLHADAIGSRLGATSVPEALPIAATTLLVAGMTRVQQAANDLNSRVARKSDRDRQFAWTGLLVTPNPLSPHAELCLACLFIPRAPPRRA